MVNARRLLNLSPLRITSCYVVFGVVWILVSDRFVVSMANSQTALTTIQTIKGWIFVGISGFLILCLTNLHQQQLTATRSRLETTHQQLQVLHRVFRHNIRNDMTVIGGYIDLTQERVTSSQVQEFLDTARNAVEHILGISEKFRLVGKVDPQPDENAYVDLVELVQRAREEIRAEHPDVTIEASLPDSARVMGDRTLIHAVREVFENAIEHNDKPRENRRIDVSVEKTCSEVTMRVRDNGPGIPEDELAALRTGEETQLVHLSGIGLWIVQWLCEYHGGDVEYSIGSDRGTEATLQFELAPRPTLVEDFAKNDSESESIPV